jgi:diaminopimelate epimerase
MNTIPFCKFSGSGNDFIIIDNRDRVIDENGLSDFIAGVCRRKMSVGANGLILVENSKVVDFKWRFFNSDGSTAEMCGNGARCTARFAYLNDIAGPEMAFETEAGIVSAAVQEDRVKLKMTDPKDLETDYVLELKNGPVTLSGINTGVPHAVLRVVDIDKIDVSGLGREIRFHERFSPSGANVNFVSGKTGLLSVRTYERGVEDETLACGTGAVAAALITAFQTGRRSPIDVMTRSGCTLKVHFREKAGVFSDVHLEGDARLIFRGELEHEAWQ